MVKTILEEFLLEKIVCVEERNSLISLFGCGVRLQRPAPGKVDDL